MTGARSFAAQHVDLHSTFTPDDDDCVSYCPERNNVMYSNCVWNWSLLTRASC